MLEIQIINDSSMKLLHTSDWHLGKRLENFSRLEEQKQVLSEICGIADKENVDAILVAGDLFDNFNPSTEAIDLFYKTLSKLSNYGKRPVIAIAGNHDSPDRIEAPNPLARECGIILLGYPNTKLPVFTLESGLQISKSDNGFVELKLPSSSTPLRILLTPYANEIRLKTYLGNEDSEAELRNVLQSSWQDLADKYCNDKGVNILITHLFVLRKGENPESTPEPEDEKPILHVGGAQAIYSENIPSQIQYVALGHLHKNRQVAEIPCPINYSGSPIAYSMGEANQEKFVNIVEIEPNKKAKSQQIQLNSGKRLLKKTFEEVDEAVKWLETNPDVLVELTMKTETFLTSQERRKILKSHKGIVGSIIPMIKGENSSKNENNQQPTIDLSKNTRELFQDYFHYKYNQPPNKEIIELLEEILAQ